MANKKENLNRHEFDLKVEGENWTKKVDAAFEKVRKTKNVDGFRKGKVTREVFNKKFGPQEYLLEAANSAVSEEFLKIMKENDYKLVAEPQIHVHALTEEKMEFSMTLVEEPELTIKKYQGLGIKKEEVSVSDEEIEHELGHLLERFSELATKDGDTVENGDVAVIDFEGFKDGVAFDGGKGENYSLEIGSGSFIPGFEEQVIGMKVNEEKEIEVTFPEEYHEESLKGQKAIFKVKVHEIKVRKQRELDEEFFEDLGLEGVNDEASLKEEIKKSIEAQKESMAEENYVKALLEAVSKNAEVDIPEEMVYDVTENMLESFKQRLAMQGLNYEMYLQFSQTTEEEIMSQMEKEAFSRVLTRLTLEKIKKLENITVSNEEVEEKLKSMAETYNMKEEEVLKQIGSKEMLKYDLEMNKTVDFLKEANK